MVRNPQIIQRLDDQNRIALQWAKQVTFHPGIHQGKPVKVVLSREIQWMVR